MCYPNVFNGSGSSFPVKRSGNNCDRTASTDWLKSLNERRLLSNPTDFDMIQATPQNVSGFLKKRREA
jgi:hypothetical protein